MIALLLAALLAHPTCELAHEIAQVEPGRVGEAYCAHGAHIGEAAQPASCRARGGRVDAALDEPSYLLIGEAEDGWRGAGSANAPPCLLGVDGHGMLLVLAGASGDTEDFRAREGTAPLSCSAHGWHEGAPARAPSLISLGVTGAGDGAGALGAGFIGLRAGAGITGGGERHRADVGHRIIAGRDGFVLEELDLLVGDGGRHHGLYSSGLQPRPAWDGVSSLPMDGLCPRLRHASTEFDKKVSKNDRDRMDGRGDA